MNTRKKALLDVLKHIIVDISQYFVVHSITIFVGTVHLRLSFEVVPTVINSDPEVSG